MLTLSRRQMALLAAAYEAEFVRRVRTFLAEQAPELAAAAGEAIDTRIVDACAAARGLGLETEQELVAFVVLSLLHGDGFASREGWAVQAIAAHQKAGQRDSLVQALMQAGTGRDTIEGEGSA